MLSDDVYRAQFRATISELEAWLHSLRPVASIEISVDAASWRVVATPFAARACPFELVLRDDQRFDIAIAGEQHEEQLVESLGVFLPLLRSITTGDVILRSSWTGATGALVGVETIVGRDAGSPLQWRRKRNAVWARRLADGDGVLVSDRHFAPYARGV